MPTPREISELRKLIEHNFVDWSKVDEKEVADLKSKIKKKDLKGLSDKRIYDLAKAEEIEKFKSYEQFPKYVKIPYPKPMRKFRLIYELYEQSIEETYFWMLHQLRNDNGLHEVIKITDIFTASEQSSMWGNAQQRIAAQQDRAGQYMKVISDMIKGGLFQMMRELRSIDERLEYYKNGDGNDYVLKDMWISLVEGGAKNVGSVYGLAQNLQMITLPDLFFRTHIKTLDPNEAEQEISKKINDLKSSFNDKVLEVLHRKLKQFVTWRHLSRKELEQRRKFNLKILRQQYNSIKLYMSWIKPYLKNLKRLAMNESEQESPEIIGAFETSVVELEIMTRRPVGTYQEIEEYEEDVEGKRVKKTKTHDKYMYGVVMATINYRSKPMMSYSREYQRGAIHVGRTELELRSYAWSEDECKNYVNLRNSEMFDMLGDYDQTLKQIFDEFGDEFKKYLVEQGEEFDKKEESKKQSTDFSSAYDPFKQIYYGFKDLFGSLVPSIGDNKAISDSPSKSSLEKPAQDLANFVIWNAYKNYKKSHGMLSW